MAESSALIDSLRCAASFGTGTAASAGPDVWMREGLPRGQLHEIYAVDGDDAPAATGFAIACMLAANAVPVLWLRTESAQRAAGQLHGPGLIEIGLAPALLTYCLVADEAALLRAAADAARCAGVGTLVVESRGRAPGIDLTATRRLMLAAEASGVTVLSLRLGAEPAASAAATRWGIAAAASIALPANAPGHPAMTVELLRRRGGPAGARWRVEWKRDARTFVETADPPPLSGARLPLAADRAAAGYPRAPLRRAG